MKVQELYDLRERLEFCSGEDLHRFFVCKLDNPSPSGYEKIDDQAACDFVVEHIDQMLKSNSHTLDGLYSAREQAELTTFLEERGIINFNRACMMLAITEERKRFSQWLQANDVPAYALARDWAEYFRAYQSIAQK